MTGLIVFIALACVAWHLEPPLTRIAVALEQLAKSIANDTKAGTNAHL